MKWIVATVCAGVLVIGSPLNPRTARAAISIQPENARVEIGANSWSAAGPLNVARLMHTATRLNDGRVLVVGGQNDSGRLSSCELYNPATNSWSLTGSLRATRCGHTAALLTDGKVLVAGGYTDTKGGRTGRALDSCEVFDPATGRFSATGGMSAPRGLSASVRLQNGKVLLMNAEIGYGGACDLYDPATARCVPTGSFPLAGITYFYTADAILLADGRVLAIGGTTAAYEESCFLYDPNSGSWTRTGSTRYHGSCARLALLPNGRVLAMGGGGHDRSSQLFDPATGTWAPAGSMTTGAATATRLPDGRIVTTPNGSGACDIFDSASGTWGITSPLATPRDWHRATLLADGRVLVSGGRYAGNICEIYQP